MLYNSNKINFYLVLSALLILIASCTPKNKNNNTKTITDTIYNQTPDNQEKDKQCNAYAFYKLDDKYSAEINIATVEQWLVKKSDAIHTDSILNNLFEHNGGGPLGSQWNPYTDLYIAIKLPVTSSKEVALFINGSLYNQKTNIIKNILWYQVPLKYWEKNLKKIDSTDIIKMYPKEDIDFIIQNKGNPYTSLNEGEILKFEIDCGTSKKIVKYFHAAYGE